MMIVSLRITRRRLLGLLGILGAAALWVMLLFTGMAERAVMGAAEGAGMPVMETAAASELDAETNHARVAFLESFGWEVKEAPAEIAEITLPETFSEVMERYNRLQLEQGFDLTPYRGKAVTRWCYEILNYPDVVEGERVVANLLVYQNRIIGGDVCSATMNGFMHGFAGDSGYEE